MLLHFGDTKRAARRTYREFVKKGMDHGRRPEFQGEGLVRPGRGKGDKRIPGSGEFVGHILADSEKIEGYEFLRKVSLSGLVEKVSTYLDADDEFNRWAKQAALEAADKDTPVAYVTITEIKPVHSRIESLRLELAA